ncbi:MAG: hypothetical protein WCW35_05980 [Bacteroidota bacterium]
MERPITLFFLILLLVSAATWLASSTAKNYAAGSLVKFGTAEFNDSIGAAREREVYHLIAERSIIAFFSYPIVLLSAIGFLKTTRRTFKQDGWLLMSALLFFLFIPVELYCFWLDWKLVELNYWGNWPLEELRKAMIHRLTALAGLPFIAQLCYFTIPFILVVKPFKQSPPNEE